MGWEAMMSWQVNELERQLECACRESEDRAAKAPGAWVVKLLAMEQATTAERGLAAVVERATIAEQGLTAAKVHLMETKVAL